MGLFSGLMRGLRNGAADGNFAAAQAMLEGDTQGSFKLFQAAMKAKEARERAERLARTRSAPAGHFPDGAGSWPRDTGDFPLPPQNCFEPEVFGSDLQDDNPSAEDEAPYYSGSTLSSGPYPGDPEWGKVLTLGGSENYGRDGLDRPGLDMSGFVDRGLVDRGDEAGPGGYGWLQGRPRRPRYPWGR